MDVTNYFATARERYQIRLKRLAGEKPPWTKDPVFQDHRFCNVHREHDRTTEWFAQHIRSKLTGVPLVQATVAFRWFNRIESAEIIEDILLGEWQPDEIRRRLADVRPVVTGAYMIRTEYGMNKLDGVVHAIDEARPILAKLYEGWGPSIEDVVEDLARHVNGMGRFLAYEVATDLRWTHVLGEADDIMKWANAGPGCTHGLGRLFDDPWKWNRNHDADQQEMVETMQALVTMSQDEQYWPQDWTPWEMREAEHWACEYDKWCRGTAGDRLKRRFRAV